ncbi:hypothetical protein RAS1_19950 [Phycisphaerae bacterium RAS1]|nr:hypothetical protein RAS1_19950 [Phycisphaerae bacterium RAS1]
MNGMPVRRPAHCARLAALLLLIAPAAHSPGQAPAPAPPATSPVVTPYADPSFGFELQLPAGWELDRSRFRGAGDSIGLLRGRQPAGRQSLEIVVFRSFGMPWFTDWIKEFEKQLAASSNVTKIASRNYARLDRPAAVINLEARVGGQRTLSSYLCVLFDPSTVWVFLLTSVVPTPESDAAVGAQFEEIVGTLVVQYAPEQGEQLAEAFKRGRALLAALRGRAESVSIDESARFYLILVKDKPIGYFTRKLTREERALDASSPGARRKAGLRVREESWRFGDDGAGRYARLDLFCSFDLRSELIEQQQTQFARPEAGGRPLVTLDQCIREDDILFSSFSTSVDRNLPEPRQPLRLGPEYLGLAWLNLLPGFLSTGPQELHAFAVYDSPTRALMASLIKPLGKQPLPGDPQTPANAFEVREGYVARPSKLYSTDAGAMLRLEAGELVLEQTTREKVEELFAAKRSALEHRAR